MYRRGISKTFAATESRERGYANWASGATAWVLPYKVGTKPSLGADAQWNDGSKSIPPGATALNYGPANVDDVAHYVVPADDFFINKGPCYGNGRAWGPSSEHSGGVVMHVFADAHVQALSDDIDATVYYRLTTRAGGEPLSMDEP